MIIFPNPLSASLLIYWEIIIFHLFLSIFHIPYLIIISEGEIII